MIRRRSTPWIHRKSRFLIAAIVSGVIFGFIHITNPNATLLSSLIVALTVPVLVRLGLLVTGAGLLVLLVSAIRERIYTRKRDRYDDVER